MEENHKERKLTPAAFRRMSRSLVGQLALVSGEQVVFAHLGAAGQLADSADDLKKGKARYTNDGKNVADEPHEHQELHAAVDTAIEAADVALDAAVAAAWQLYWVIEHCDCQRCQIRRQQANAHLS